MHITERRSLLRATRSLSASVTGRITATVLTIMQRNITSPANNNRPVPGRSFWTTKFITYSANSKNKINGTSEPIVLTDQGNSYEKQKETMDAHISRVLRCHLLMNKGK